MSDRDFAIGTVGIPQVGQVSNKPRYLIQMNPGTFLKSKPWVYFIALDKPAFEAQFISVKGFYVDVPELSKDKTEKEVENDIISSFTDLVAETPKELIQDLLIPTHRVHVIRSLVFNANKPSTLPNR
jgi:hypothetical protein